MTDPILAYASVGFVALLGLLASISGRIGACARFAAALIVCVLTVAIAVYLGANENEAAPFAAVAGLVFSCIAWLAWRYGCRPPGR